MRIIWEDFLEEVGCEWDSEEGKESETDSGRRKPPLYAQSYFLTLSTMRMALSLKI